MFRTSSHSASAASDSVADNIGRISGVAHQAVDRLADSAVSATERLGRGREHIAAAREEWVGAARDCVRDHPFVSIAVALGVGAILTGLGSSLAARERDYD